MAYTLPKSSVSSQQVQVKSSQKLQRRRLVTGVFCCSVGFRVSGAGMRLLYGSPVHGPQGLSERIRADEGLLRLIRLLGGVPWLPYDNRAGIRV